ncbi:MAG: FAD-dependent oxidoreductase [Deltaproteobacteria bacterium]|nr:FAD-dependent oxidoreductase [Deltaproteobacteria bacterium]MBW2417412.1 FAD-dependent oxidoreductase [Deltaproteobacteria bacterium]
MSETEQSRFDHDVDFLIVGSGAGAMTAGIIAADEGARVLLIEKSPQYGGSSAMSGGGLWVPNHHLMEAEGFRDTPEAAFDYMKGCVGDIVSDVRVHAYLENAPKVVKYLCDKAGLRMRTVPDYADYYPEVEGSMEGGRTLEPLAYHGRDLGNDEFVRMRETAPQEMIMGIISMTIPEAQALLTRSPGWIRTAARLMLTYLFDLPWRFRSRRDRRLAMGNALVGMLRRALMDRDVPLWLETPARQFVIEDGRVIGVEAEQSGRTIRIRAQKGVLLAAGGFESNQAMREKYLPSPTRAEWTCASPYNTGDIIEMGREAGAELGLMDDAWWGPGAEVPGEARARLLIIEKSLPGGIMVNRSGKRFVCETAPYIDVVNVMYGEGPGAEVHVPCYLVFDATFRKKYPVGPLLPGAQQPDWLVSRQLKTNFLNRANTLEELARKMGIDAGGLRQTVDRFNADAREGVDHDFHRGETAFDKFFGDMHVEPNPCMAPIVKPPFYCMTLIPGELGTKGGLLTDEFARVLTTEGGVIPGLYATGNCSASVMGRTYPGAGSTLGPTTTFGYVAARHALGVAE